MDTKNVILVTVIATVFLVAAVGSASALPDCPAPENTKINVSCELNQSYNVQAGHGYIIDADDITIDGKGHTITGVGCSATAPPIVGVLNFNTTRKYGYNNVTIKNLEVENFCMGIRIGGKYNPTTKKCVINVVDNMIEHCTVHDNGNSSYVGDASTGINFWPCVNYSTITKCDVYNTTGSAGTPPCESGGAGIRLKMACKHNDITDNTLHNNRGPGILAKAKCQYDYVANNDMYQNGEVSYTGPTGGIVLRCKNSNNWLIEENNIQDNYGPGIWIGGSWNVVKDNTVEGSKNRTAGDVSVGRGISIERQPEAGKNNRLEDNKVCFNEGGDIFVLASGYNNTGDENCCDIAENYDDDGTTGCTYCCTKDLIITDIWLGRDWSCISREDIELEQKEIEEFICEADVKNVEQEELIDYIKERDVDQEKMTKELAVEKCIRGRRVHYRIMNRGCQEWAGWSVSNLTVDGVSPWPPWLGWDLVRPLAPKTSREEWFWLYRLPGGQHNVKVCADFPNWISECNETNNCLTKTLGGPTLVTPIPIPPRER